MLRNTLWLCRVTVFASCAAVLSLFYNGISGLSLIGALCLMAMSWWMGALCAVAFIERYARTYRPGDPEAWGIIVASLAALVLPPAFLGLGAWQQSVWSGGAQAYFLVAACVSGASALSMLALWAYERFKRTAFTSMQDLKAEASRWF